MDFQLLGAFLAGVALLMFLILRWKVNAFLALLIAAMSIGLMAGMSFEELILHTKEGMGGTLAYVGVVIGLGAIFGAILEHSGATQILSQFLLQKFGLEKSPMALSIAGFFIAIPVFFDVAFILLVPVIYGLQRKTGKSLLYFAIPLLASLAVTHAFIPPTPGPIAVAEIIGADLGWVILYGFLVGVPTTILAGLIFGKYIANRMFVPAPSFFQPTEKEDANRPPVMLVLALILLPLTLILLSTALPAFIDIASSPYKQFFDFLVFLGHPFCALILSTLLAMYFLSYRYGISAVEVQKVSMKALGPAGSIILITGAGGVFKQMLQETGVGVLLAEQMADWAIHPLGMAFVLALLVRVLQGSATVAMITAAGIVGPLITDAAMSPSELSLMVLAVAAGASGFSHVNDSGFWLVNKYLGISEVQTFRSWTVMTGILSLSAFLIIVLLYFWV